MLARETVINFVLLCFESLSPSRGANKMLAAREIWLPSIDSGAENRIKSWSWTVVLLAMTSMPVIPSTYPQDAWYIFYNAVPRLACSWPPSIGSSHIWLANPLSVVASMRCHSRSSHVLPHQTVRRAPLPADRGEHPRRRRYAPTRRRHPRARRGPRSLRQARCPATLRCAALRDRAADLQPAGRNPRGLRHRAHRRADGLRPAVGADRLRRGDRTSRRRPRLRLLARTRGVGQCLAPAGRIGIGPCLRRVAGRLSCRGRRRARVAPAVSRHGLAG